MMKVHFIKVNPVENMTIFVMDQVPRSQHKTLAKKLMNYNNLHGEQVGFIERGRDEESPIRLQMMGGEFCGNATRSLAAFMVHSSYPGIQEKDGRYLVDLETSGMGEKVECQVLKKDENKYLSQIEMPLPLAIRERELRYKEGVISLLEVEFEGIIHFIIDEEKIGDRDEFYLLIKDYLRDRPYEAFGIMYYDFQKNFVTPLVYVKATDTLFWERSCASGTAALGAALSHKDKKTLGKSIDQPGGSLSVKVKYRDGAIETIELDGLVEIVAEGILYI